MLCHAGAGVDENESVRSAHVHQNGQTGGHNYDWKEKPIPAQKDH